MEPIWTPTPQRIQASNLHRFMRDLERRHGARLADYASLHRFSGEQPAHFWSAVWDFCEVIAETRGDAVVEHIDRMPGARWFPHARLNFAENLLRRRDDAEAIVALSETGAIRRMSFAELHANVSRAEQALRAAGVSAGDRVAGLLPNVPETVIAMLATTAIGAIWSVCSTDVGIDAVVERFEQIAPTIFLVGDRYTYEGKPHDLLAKGAAVAGRLPSVERVVVIAAADCDLSTIPNAMTWSDFVAPHEAKEIVFPQFPFDHPALILFSSGTSGAPKCIVHSAGGALLQNLKDLRLQFDVKRDDRIFWWTGTGWVVWNLMLFGLGCEATVMLYDGSPFHPKLDSLLEFAEKEHVTFLRLTPKYVETIAKAGLEPARDYALEDLRCITVGGAPFAKAGYEYVYGRLKRDVQLASPAGGTDPLCALVSGNPISPVYAGEMQCRGLGIELEVFDEMGRPVESGPGELVCTLPFPSLPLGFWNDEGGERYRTTYFGIFPNVWRQGDWAEITPRGSVIIYGRSDATLKVRGVRIGTAEIYRQLEYIAEVVDSVVVALERDNASEIALFVQLADGNTLDDALRERIRGQIRTGASPRYVPDRIVQVTDIPRTSTGKVSEVAVSAALHGREVRNRNAIVNPEALALFAALSQNPTLS